MRLRLILFLLIGLLAAAAPLLAAALPDSVQQNFTPVDGIVILATPGQILIDRDATNAVNEGDLFAVLGSGEEIIHPVTKQSLGRRETVKGWLRVTRLHTGYSEAVLLDPSVAVAAGESISRFNGVEALMIDLVAGSGADLYTELRNQLPQLRWLGYFTAGSQLPASDGKGLRLVFTAARGTLEVREAATGLLRRYQLEFAASAAAAQPAPTFVNTVPDEYWNGPTWTGTPRAMEVIDLDGDGKLETITASHRTIEVGRFNGRSYTRLSSFDLGLAQKILGIDGCDTDGDGRPELWVTAARDSDLDSLVLRWQDNKLQIAARSLHWWFRALSLPKEGRVLFAQRMGTEDFEGPILRARLDGQLLQTGSELVVPHATNLYGLASIAAGDEPLTLRLTSLDHLQVVTAQNEILAESEDLYGGSEAYIERLDSRFSTVDRENRNVYVPARLEWLGGQTILAPVNIGSRAFARYREFNKSRLDILQWDGVSLRTLREGRAETGYLADYRKGDVDNDGKDELVMLLQSSHKGKGRYALVIRETVFPKD